MTGLWAVAWLIVLAGGLWLEAAAAAAVFALSAVVFGLGECFQGPVQGALVADLAPPLLRGRYMAVSANSWDLGFLVGPALGGVILATAPLALWPLAAVACLLAGAAALGLERRIPRELRLTPA
jgi:MFS family permease